MCGFFENANVINTTVGLVLALWASATALAWRSKACHDLDTRAINNLLRKSRQAIVVIQRQCLRFCSTCVHGSPSPIPLAVLENLQILFRCTGSKRGDADRAATSQ